MVSVRVARPILASSFSSKGSVSGTWMVRACEGMASSGVVYDLDGPLGWSWILCSIRITSDTNPAKQISQEKYLCILLCSCNSCIVSNAVSQYEHLLSFSASAWQWVLLTWPSNSFTSLKVLEQNGQCIKWVGLWTDNRWASLNCLPHSWHLYSFFGWVPKWSIYMLKTLNLWPHLQHLKIFCLSWCTLLMWLVRPDSDVHTFSQNLHWWTVPDTKPVGPLSMGFFLFPSVW